MPKSFYLPDFEGISNADQCADMDALNLALSKGLEVLGIVTQMISFIERQKQIVSELTFTYKIEYFRHRMYGEEERYYHYVSVMAVPSNPDLRSFRINDTYTQCYSWADAVYRAKNLVNDFKEKGIDVEFDPAVME
jgi:hypothetical protein